MAKNDQDIYSNPTLTGRVESKNSEKKDIGDFQPCEICNAECYCFTLHRQEATTDPNSTRVVRALYLCPLHFFEYLPDYHQEALTEVAEVKLKIRGLRNPFA